MKIQRTVVTIFLLILKQEMIESHSCRRALSIFPLRVSTAVVLLFPSLRFVEVRTTTSTELLPPTGPPSGDTM